MSQQRATVATAPAGAPQTTDQRRLPASKPTCSQIRLCDTHSNKTWRMVSLSPHRSQFGGSFSDSWRESLRFKAKYETRKIKIQRGEIVPTKRTRKSTLTSGETTAKRMKIPTPVVEVWDGEDESSTRSHIACMKKELLKPKANIYYVTDCMLWTFRIRRDWIEKECPSIQAITD
ncbi:uncharacterized protein [Dermacentor albipictus]|uniref:uncharacterized protein n=1 Tax=Dermacentor albipictus TaxID=60249 RepID=UPI0038FD1B3D